MKRVLIPYYVSRAVLSALLGAAFVLGGQPWWLGVLMAAVLFAGFLWYAHSGRYAIDPSTPLTPLRRDERGNAIRDRAVVWAVVVGGVLFAALSLAGTVFQVTIAAGSLAMLSGVITYFAVTNWLYTRDA
jgi:hypothetical protein